MTVILDIVLPVFGLVLLGYGAAKAGWFDTAAVRGLSLFVFNFAIPVMLFRTMARTDLPDRIEWGFLLSYYGGAFGVFFLGMALSGLLFGRKLDGQGIAGITAAYSNTILLGIPLILTAFGEAAGVPLFLMIAFHSLLLLPTVTIVVEAGQGGRLGLRKLILVTGRGLVRNPIIGGLVAGLLFNATGLAIPGLVDSLARTLGAAALPCATFAMGASLAGYRIAGNLREALSLVGLKLAIHPLLVWGLATFVFAVDPFWTAVAVVLAALPSGVNAYLFAQRYAVGIATAATAVFLSTAISIATVSVLLLLLSGG